jgi:hypothetical protein
MSASQGYQDDAMDVGEKAYRFAGTFWNATLYMKQKDK